MKSLRILTLGALAASLFITGCACCTQPKSGDAALIKRFKQADKNGDGKVSRAEFTDLMITEAFGYYDKDGKGYVTLEEFVAGGGTPATYRKIDRAGSGKVTLANAKASRIVRDQFVKPFDGADTSRNGHVSYDEFMAYRQAASSYVR